MTIIQTAGDTISQILQSAGEAFQVFGDAVATVVDSISGGISSVLQALADVITSIGDAALNTGKGFNQFANGVRQSRTLILQIWEQALGRSLRVWVISHLPPVG